VPSAVEELLRFVCPAQISEERYARCDVQFHGRTLRRGDSIVASLASANSDPACFDHPERLDITRSPNPHVAFGTGAHFCLGAQLARIEAQVAIEKVFSRFPNLSLAVSGDGLRYTGQINLRALTALPVRLT
jgi:cytochrome P450